MNGQSERSTRRGAVARKKACHACTVAKARCDLIRPICSRCFDRELDCQYSGPAPAGPRNRRPFDAALTPSSSLSHQTPSPAASLAATTPSTTAFSPAATDDGFPALATAPPTLPLSLSSSSVPSGQAQAAANFTDGSIDLLAPLDVTRMRDRWLDFYFTPTSKQVKNYSARTIALISRAIASYPAMWARKQSHLPPFIHSAQCAGSTGMPEPLANCLSLLRLCDNAAQGSETLVRESFQREMARLAGVVDESCRQKGASCNLLVLAALQAYLLLAIQAYFSGRKNPAVDIFTPATLSGLQEVSSKVSAAGIVCPEELGGQTGPGRRGTPPWESWIIAEAKRRTVYCVYYLENVYNFNNGAVSYLGEELALLPAPAPKWVWEARDRLSFETEYRDWMRVWEAKRALVMAEFWPHGINDDAEETGSQAQVAAQRQQERIAKWTEGVDDFGMLLLAVCTATHNT